MDATKVILGTAAGVGAVVCLPVAGAIGTVTLLGAAVAGTLGGVVGAAMSELEDDEKKEELSKGRRHGWDECLYNLDKLTCGLDDAKEKLKSGRDVFLNNPHSVWNVTGLL